MLANAERIVIRIEFLRGVEDEIDTDPEELGVAIEKDRESHDQGNSGDLGSDHGKIGAKDNIEDEEDTDDRRETKVHHVGTEHVSVFRFEAATATRALFLEREPILEDVALAAEWATPQQRSTEANSEALQTVRRGIWLARK